MSFITDIIINGKHSSTKETFLFNGKATEFFDKHFATLKRISGEDQDVIEYEGLLHGKKASVMLIKA